MLVSILEQIEFLQECTSIGAQDLINEPRKKSVHSIDQIHEEPEVDGARCQELGANLAERQQARAILVLPATWLWDSRMAEWSFSSRKI